MINIGIVGYGNLGKGVELAASKNGDINLVRVFTRRDAGGIGSGVPAEHISAIAKYKGEIDVMILCGGSATDLPTQTPEIASMFNVVDSYDNHAQIPEHFAKVDDAAKRAGTVGIVSAGWDPGLFSIMRLLGDSVLPGGKSYTFWGKGVSQGHSDAIRRIPGVVAGVQYTLPVDESVRSVRRGENPQLTTRQKHTRECWVVARDDADKDAITQAIVTMPYYFDDYNTTVNFITMDEFDRNHRAMPHGGIVLHTESNGGNVQRMEFGLELASNPEFTSCVILACARAAYRIAKGGGAGAYTMYDFPLSYLSPKSSAQIIKDML